MYGFFIKTTHDLTCLVSCKHRFSSDTWLAFATDSSYCSGLSASALHFSSFVTFTVSQIWCLSGGGALTCSLRRPLWVLFTFDRSSVVLRSSSVLESDGTSLNGDMVWLSDGWFLPCYQWGRVHRKGVICPSVCDGESNCPVGVWLRLGGSLSRGGLCFIT